MNQRVEIIKTEEENKVMSSNLMTQNLIVILNELFKVRITAASLSCIIIILTVMW